MNLQCPNCQKLLTVPEQHAGQLMKCPLCRGNFTVPALPAGDGMNQTPAFAPPPPPPPMGQDVYGVRNEPEPVPAFQGAPPPPAPAFSSAAPEPAFSVGAPPAAPPPPSVPPSSVTTGPSMAPAPMPRPTEGYTRTLTVWISDKVLQWVPPVALLLIFVLSFFTWVTVSPGGVDAVWQSGWGAAFGYWSQDADMKEVFRIETDKDVADSRNKVSNEPGLSLLTVFYFLPFFFVALIVTLAVAALPFIKVPLPPQVQQILPWRWAIVAGLNAILLLFLGLQLLLGFSLENNVKARFDNMPQIKKEGKDTKETKIAAKDRGQMLESLERSIWLKLVVLLQVLATLSAALVYWIEKRGPSKPLPRFEIQW